MNVRGGPVRIGELLECWFEVLEGRSFEARSAVPLSTGLHAWDRLTGGLGRGSVHVIGGRPQHGRTALALSIARFVAVECGHTVLIATASDTRENVVERLLVQEAREPATGYLDRMALLRKDRALRRLGRAPLHITAWPTDLDELRRQCRTLHPRVLVVDDVQQLSGMPARGQAEWLSRQIANAKRAARELELSVVLTSQVDDRVERRSDRRPQLADLSITGSLEDHADTVSMLYREELYDPRSPMRGILEAWVAKNRIGPPGVCQFAFLDHLGLVANLASAA